MKGSTSGLLLRAASGVILSGWMEASAVMVIIFLILPELVGLLFNL